MNERQRIFTAKALTFAILGTLAIAAGASASKLALRQTSLIGSHFPAAPYALVVLMVLAWNPTIGRCWERLRFSARELALALCLMLLCAWIPDTGLFRFFHRTLILPQMQAESRPEWRQHALLERLPPGAIPLGGSPEALALHRAIADERAARASGQVPAQDPRTYDDALERIAAMPGKRFANSTEPAGGTDDGLAWRRVHRGFLGHLPAAQQEWERVYLGFQQGLTAGDEALPLAEVPFDAWLPTLWYWLPLLLCFTVAMAMLALVVHRQWSRHEQLPFPIAQVSGILLDHPAGSPVASILRQRLFWFGLAPVFLILVLNYLSAWFPGRLPSVTLHWWQGGQVFATFPTANRTGECGVGFGNLYFTIVGMAWFISSEVSLSMWLAPPLLLIFSIQYNLATGATTDMASARSGAYLGCAVILLWTGRRYYKAVLVRACGLSGGAQGDMVEPVWAARLFLAAFAGLVWVMAGPFGIDWVIALLFALTLMVYFLVFTRVICETGVPFLQASWVPATLLGNTLGIGAIGTGPMALILYLGTVLSSEPQESLMPYASTGYQVAEQHGISRLRLVAVGGGLMVAALVVAFVFWTWGFYQHGAGASDVTATNAAAGRLDIAARLAGTLSETGRAAEPPAGLARLACIPDNLGNGKALGWTFFGLCICIGVSIARFRLTWWPLHPVLFLVWGTWTAAVMWVSFLVGWGAKALVVRFGGDRAYQALKPFFIGLIVGELLGVAMTILVGGIAYLCTGRAPPSFTIFP